MVCMFFDVVWLIMLAMSALCIKIATEDSVSAVTCAVNNIIIFVLCSVHRVVGMASSTLHMVRNLFTPCLAINQITNSFST